jgi:hypothetical protein
MKPICSHTLQNAFALLFILPILTVLLLFNAGVSYGQSIQGYHTRMAMLPYPFSTVAEFDKTASTFYGIIRVDRENFFASVNIITGKTILLNKLPSFDGLFRNASALDEASNIFFFIAISKGKPHLCIVDIKTGHLIKSLPLSDSVRIMKFDPQSKSLLGIARFGHDRFVSIDPDTGKVTALSKLPPIRSFGAGALLEGSNLIFIVYRKDREHVCAVDIKTGAMKELSGEHVGLNEYKVKSFNKSKNAGILFTTGVQSCVAIAGYDPESSAGFIAHFTAGHDNIDKALSEIENNVRRITNNRGLKNMKLYVVGGVRDLQDSRNTLMFVYTQLVDRYGVNFDEITKFNTGISHTIIIDNGEVKIF